MSGNQKTLAKWTHLIASHRNNTIFSTPSDEVLDALLFIKCEFLLHIRKCSNRLTGAVQVVIVVHHVVLEWDDLTCKRRSSTSFTLSHWGYTTRLYLYLNTRRINHLWRISISCTFMSYLCPIHAALHCYTWIRRTSFVYCTGMFAFSFGKYLTMSLAFFRTGVSDRIIDGTCPGLDGPWYSIALFPLSQWGSSGISVRVTPLAFQPPSSLGRLCCWTVLPSTSSTVCYASQVCGSITSSLWLSSDYNLFYKIKESKGLHVRCWEQKTNSRQFNSFL